MVPAWKFHPNLSEQYIVTVADIIRRARGSAAKAAKWKLGDTLWSIGCVSFERARRALYMAAKDEYRDWLSIEEPENHLLVKIKMVPFRFYRGFLNEPIPDRYVDATPSERRALQYAFEAEGLTPFSGHLRLEVATTPKGFPTSITFFRVDAEGKRCEEWTVPRVSAKRGRVSKIAAPVVESLDAGARESTASGGE